jgi:hypothetical protein
MTLRLKSKAVPTATIDFSTLNLTEIDLAHLATLFVRMFLAHLLAG